MALSGDFAGLDDLRRKVGELTRAGFRSELSDVLGAAAMKQVADEFREERDPYGEAWAPLKYRKGRILRDTGRMAASVDAQPTSNGFRLNIPVAYAPVHQFGGFVAPHSRTGAHTIFHNPRTGQIVSRTTRLKMVYESRYSRQTYAKGITIPQRRMVPESGRGLGPIWAKAFRRETSALMRRRLTRAN